MLTALGNRALGGYPLGEGPHAPTLAGLIIGARGLTDTNAPSYTFTEPLVVDLFAWGAGGGGAAHPTLMTGGGGGAAGYARLIANTGDVLSWTLGPALRGQQATSPVGGTTGVDTVVTFKSRVMTAQGGRPGRTDGVAAGRAFATGFDLNRYGGGSGERGEGGAAPPGSQSFYPGTAGGFSDIFPGVQQVRGQPYTGDGTQGAIYPAPPTAASGGHGSGTDGNDVAWSGGGLLIAFMYRV